MKIFVINGTQISVDLASVCFWIWIADKRLRFLQTKHLQCVLGMAGAVVDMPFNSKSETFWI